MSDMVCPADSWVVAHLPARVIVRRGVVILAAAAAAMVASLAAASDRAGLLEAFREARDTWDVVDVEDAVRELEKSQQRIRDSQRQLRTWTGEFSLRTQIRVENAAGDRRNVEVYGEGEFCYSRDRDCHRSRFERIGEGDSLAGRVVYSLCRDGVALEWADEPGSASARLQGDPQVAGWSVSSSRVIQGCSRDEFVKRALYGEFFDLHRMRNHSSARFADRLDEFGRHFVESRVVLRSRVEDGVKRSLLVSARPSGVSAAWLFTSKSECNLETFCVIGADSQIYHAVQIEYDSASGVSAVPRRFRETRWDEAGVVLLELQIDVLNDAVNDRVDAEVFSLAANGLRDGDRVRDTNEAVVSGIVLGNEIVSVAEFERWAKSSR